ncbi:YggS family pyridoxal phosphate-dependent enzyme [candidate division WOR-3 bacterium]|nr:YggS family pyridoxal phosphate-dependent enzyme [candidate division WOR-3 bacterium]
MTDIRENIERVRQRIARAAKSVGRDPDSITIVAATKSANPEEIDDCISAGIKIIGENRVKDAEQKIQAVTRDAEWHMIGHLQTNKINKALKLFSTIQSVDNLHLASAIQKRAEGVIDILVEVNTSGEETKFGIAPEQTMDFLKDISSFDKLNIVGLMTMGPFGRDPTESFRLLYHIFSSLRDSGFNMKYLSMGMTDDFETAILEGSNMVRIGRAIFSAKYEKICYN